jgi:hypothetical protein
MLLDELFDKTPKIAIPINNQGCAVCYRDDPDYEWVLNG